jgi:hypothetical protein
MDVNDYHIIISVKKLNMKKIYSLLSMTLICVSAVAQTQIANGGFETWDAAGTANEEPTSFNSNKTGTDWATSGPQTCYRDNTTFHSGSYSARVETKNFAFAVVNGSLVTGIVNAPTTNKADGYIGTMKGTITSDIRRMPFVGRPDSLIGFYKYTQGGAAERGKIRAILHTGHYYDPEAGTSHHPDSSANKIAAALFLTPTANVSGWTRFSVPFVYVDGRTPQYIMINTTSSNDQLTSVAGSKLWIDDLSVVYNSFIGIDDIAEQKQEAKVYCYENNVFVDFTIQNNEQAVFSIYDVTGKVVLTQKISCNKQTTVSVAGLNAGMYFYQVTGTDLRKTGKFFVE